MRSPIPRNRLSWGDRDPSELPAPWGREAGQRCRPWIRLRPDGFARSTSAKPFEKARGSLPGSRRTSTTEEPSREDRKSTRLNSSHVSISYAVFCLKKKTALEPSKAAFPATPAATALNCYARLRLTPPTRLLPRPPLAPYAPCPTLPIRLPTFVSLC